MKKQYAAKQIKQSPGKLHADTKKRVEAIEELLQQEENDKLCQRIYDDGYKTGATNAMKGQTSTFLFAIFGGILLGVSIAMVYVNSRSYYRRGY